MIFCYLSAVKLRKRLKFFERGIPVSTVDPDPEPEPAPQPEPGPAPTDRKLEYQINSWGTGYTVNFSVMNTTNSEIRG